MHLSQEASCEQITTHAEKTGALPRARPERSVSASFTKNTPPPPAPESGSNTAPSTPGCQPPHLPTPGPASPRERQDRAGGRVSGSQRRRGAGAGRRGVRSPARGRPGSVCPSVRPSSGRGSPGAQSPFSGSRDKAPRGVPGGRAAGRRGPRRRAALTERLEVLDSGHATLSVRPVTGENSCGARPEHLVRRRWRREKRKAIRKRFAPGLGGGGGGGGSRAEAGRGGGR